MKKDSNEYVPITLEDMGVVPVTINIKTNYGRTLSMRVMPLTCAQWAEIGAQVAAPGEPPQKSPAAMRVYAEHVDKANEERGYRRVIFAVENGGNPIPGASPSEKVQNWRKLVDQGVHNSIMSFLFHAAMGDKAEVEAAADNFQSDHGSDSEDV